MTQFIPLLGVLRFQEKLKAPSLIAMAAAPVFTLLIYVYIRDKYEKEPWRLLLAGVFWGAAFAVPIIQTQNALLRFAPPGGGVAAEAAFHAFILAALVEEGFKLIVSRSLTRRSLSFNERFDGVVYAAFVSLGFAGIENIMYVASPSLGGAATALSRALFSVPAHAFFGVCMGYYTALSKFGENRRRDALKAFIYPFLLHGTYNFLLLSHAAGASLIFGVFSAFLWLLALRQMKIHLEASPFKKTVE
ncbi:MAG: PrsW family intramembrane metalloprotease [Clostridiales bacterium]|jgi:RsiW-degrading membrane proteinase PrsW (M82 family)|nr:PrsW family intramembrane metalloprotease [Clostridiales bacterium]